MNLNYADIIFQFYDVEYGHKLGENTVHSHATFCIKFDFIVILVGIQYAIFD